MPVRKHLWRRYAVVRDHWIDFAMHVCARTDGVGLTAFVVVGLPALEAKLVLERVRIDLARPATPHGWLSWCQQPVVHDGDAERSGPGRPAIASTRPSSSRHRGRPPGLLLRSNCRCRCRRHRHGTIDRLKIMHMTSTAGEHVERRRHRFFTSTSLVGGGVISRPSLVGGDVRVRTLATPCDYDF